MTLRSIFVVVLFCFVAGGAPAFAVDIDCMISDCPDGIGACNCSSADPIQITEGQDVCAGSSLSVSGGRAPYTYDLAGGSVDQDTGTVTETPTNQTSATLTVIDNCGVPATSSVQIQALSGLTLDGPEMPGEGSQYSVSGGIAPYVWSFSGGSIDENGMVSNISACTAPGEVRSATVTATDSGCRTASIEVLLSGGAWVSTGRACVPGSETCGNQYVETGTYPNAFCDISQCYCTSTMDRYDSPDYYYTGLTSRYSVCKLPAWAGTETLTCSDGSVSTCWAYNQKWECQ